MFLLRAITLGVTLQFLIILTAICRILTRETGMLEKAISTSGSLAALACWMKDTNSGESAGVPPPRKKMKSVSTVFEDQSSGLPPKHSVPMGMIMGMFCRSSSGHVLPPLIVRRPRRVRMVSSRRDQGLFSIRLFIVAMDLCCTTLCSSESMTPKPVSCRGTTAVYCLLGMQVGCRMKPMSGILSASLISMATAVSVNPNMRRSGRSLLAQ
mmetsp:Transcript_32959/g.64665  ORF Transcript_32959/g.64665 Transcript_32959/m.64665 type:complete len:211 (+) Transcript_32959:634-1266(+)